MVTRHEFLARLHHLLAPALYMEVGVDAGDSLRLASCEAIGVDPSPRVASKPVDATVHAMTSDDYFASSPVLSRPVDFGFIDGSHLYEFALRDFMNMEKLTHGRSVIVFDDVLPYNQAMSGREMIQGDWTGDVWKVFYILQQYRPDLSMRLVDTFPTGTLLVWDVDHGNTDLTDEYNNIIAQWDLEETVPASILFRTDAITADQAIELMKDRL